jgi:hypothetical protein
VALESVVGPRMPLLALASSTCGQTVEWAVVRCSRVLCNVVLACPMEMATNSTLPPYFLRAAMRGRYVSVFSVSLVSRPRYLQNHTSTRVRVHDWLLTMDWSGL